MTCPKCGTINNDDSKFCMGCGNNLEQITQPEVIQPQYNNEVVTPQPVMQQYNEEVANPVESNNSFVTYEQSPSQYNNIENTNEGNNYQTTQEPINEPINNQTQYKTYNNNSNNKIKEFLSNKKTLYIIGGVILAIILVIIGYNVFFKSKLDKAIELMFDPNQLIIVKKDGKYGYIDTNGKFVLDAQYKSANQFHGDYAIVSTETTNDKGKKETQYHIIDKKGNIKFTVTNHYDFEYVSAYSIWIINDKLYDNSLKQISDEGVTVRYEKEGYLSWVNNANKTAGIMNHKGKETYTYRLGTDEKYFGLTVSENNAALDKTYCIANVENEKYAIVNCDTGKVIYDYTDKYISSEDNNIFEVSEKKTYKFISTMYIQNDKVAYESSSSKVELDYYAKGYIQIKDSDKPYSERYSYYDTKTGKITTEKPSISTNLSSLNEWEILTKYNIFESGSKYGIMKNNKIILNAEWDDLEYLGIFLYQYLDSKGKSYILGEKDNKTYLINLDSKKIVQEFNASYVYDSSYSPFIYYTDSATNKRVIYNLLTNKSIEVGDSKASVSIYSNYVTVTENKVKKYYNTKLKLIYTEE